MENKIDKLLDCDCDVCEYRHYINTNDCDVRRKKAIKSTLYKTIEGEVKKIRMSGNGCGDVTVRLSDVLSALKKLFDEPTGENR